MSIAIAGERSGVGKTTVTLAILATLRRRQQAVQSFKVGPDYIDPMFHAYVTGRACRNLDPILTSNDYVRACFDQHSQTADYSLIEGVMGLFDGASGTTDAGSTAQVAKLLDLPVVLILNCSSTSRSIAAIAHGYRTFDPEINLAGVILNQVGSDRHLELLTAALSPLHLPILGVLRRQNDLSIPDRHLGLIPAGELSSLEGTLGRLADVGETCFDWEKLLPLLMTTPRAPKPPAPFPGRERDGGIRGNNKIRLAVAKDAAFNFYYADNLDLLRDAGAELVEWSPLHDEQLPTDIQGLYFGGGFPEVFGEILAANQPARAAVRSAIKAGMPTYAECGGLMYLCDRIVDFNDRSYPMVGIFPTTAVMGKRLTLGYRQLTALQDTLLLDQGDRVWGHEFHRSTLTNLPPQPLFDLAGYESSLTFRSEGWSVNTRSDRLDRRVQAAYTHLHFGARPDLPQRFIDRCHKFTNKYLPLTDSLR
jgi:cobyrinic acid a,c-diamide synthase